MLLGCPVARLVGLSGAVWQQARPGEGQAEVAYAQRPHQRNVFCVPAHAKQRQRGHTQVETGEGVRGGGRRRTGRPGKRSSALPSWCLRRDWVQAEVGAGGRRLRGEKTSGASQRPRPHRCPPHTLPLPLPNHPSTSMRPPLQQPSLPVIEIHGHVSGVPLGRFAGRVRKSVPHRRRAAALCGGALRCVAGRAGAQGQGRSCAAEPCFPCAGPEPAASCHSISPLLCHPKRLINAHLDLVGSGGGAPPKGSL